MLIMVFQAAPFRFLSNGVTIFVKAVFFI